LSKLQDSWDYRSPQSNEQHEIWSNFCGARFFAVEPAG